MSITASQLHLKDQFLQCHTSLFTAAKSLSNYQPVKVETAELEQQRAAAMFHFESSKPLSWYVGEVKSGCCQEPNTNDFQA